MKHLLICREYPPAPYPAGGIGTYAMHISRLLAEAGETVHVLAQRWAGAPDRQQVSHEGRLIVHRVALDEDLSGGVAGEKDPLRMLAWSNCPSQVFSWQTARYAERLIDQEGIDLIEAPEWEAPLYYLQLRRALGLGPQRQPPCIVHLHSPTAMIFEHNEWDTTLVDYLPLSRMEEYSIRAADAWLCPSDYLARGVTDLLRWKAGQIEVIRLPKGEIEVQDRSVEIWNRDAICYVGRLELRKGVIEWVDAAVIVAGLNAGVSFDFYGRDTAIDGALGRSVQKVLEVRIPRHFRRRFRFHGAVGRDKLMEALAHFPVAVIPSRWENLPFSCIEAMATGMPVLVSPCGGMAELVEEGVSGWVAKDGSAGALADSLLQVLNTPATDRAQMGVRAAGRIRTLCGNDAVVAGHLEFRRKVAEAGAFRSCLVPGSSAGSINSSRRGIGVLADSVRSEDIDLQIRAMTLCGVVIVADKTALQPGFVEACERALQAQPGVGLVMPWQVTKDRNPSIETGPCPVSLEAMRGPLPEGSCFRCEAFLDADGQVLPLCWETLAAGGWVAVTYPQALVRTARAAPKGRRRYSGMALLQNQTRAFALAWFLAAPLGTKMRWLGQAMRKPGRLFRWVGWQR
jgi:glycogen(starch) synthase